MIEGVLFYGTPYNIRSDPPTDYHGFEWPSEAGLERIFAKIPGDVNVLLTHAGPQGVLDQDGSKNTSLGSSALQARIQSLHNLRLHAFGHTHAANGAKVWKLLPDGYKNIALVQPSLLLKCESDAKSSYPGGDLRVVSNAAGALFANAASMREAAGNWWRKDDGDPQKAMRSPLEVCVTGAGTACSAELQ